MVEYQKPLPEINDENKLYWGAAKRHELVLPKCLDCGQFYFPPAILCPHCLSMSNEWAKVSGRGRVYTWAIFHHSYHPAFKDDVPYNVAIVKLEEGPQIISNIVGCKNEDIYVDMQLEVVFDDVTAEVTLPKFKPIGRGIADRSTG
jgi:uncharacterized OB-fold protein